MEGGPADFKAKMALSEKRLTAIRTFHDDLERTRYQLGYSSGVEAEQKAQAARDKERSRAERGVPATQQEAGPGIYFLQ
jgi:hypothetical protein